MSKTRRTPKRREARAAPTAAPAPTDVRLEVRAGIPVILVVGASILPPEAEMIPETYRQWRLGLNPERARLTRTAIVDMTGVPRCGSWVFGAMVSVFREIEDRLGPGSARVLVAGLREEPANVYRYMSLESVMPRFKNVEHALDWLRQQKRSAEKRLR